MGAVIRLEEVDRTVILTVDRPPSNAIEIDLVRELEAALAGLAHRDDVGALVVTGSGSCFSAGLDLKRVPTYDRATQGEMLACINRTLVTLYGLPVPTVAAVNGHAIAAGLVLVLACDYRIGPTAPCKLGLPEARAGIPFPAVAMALVRAELAPAPARRLTLLARNYAPADALADGVLDELHAPGSLLARARDVAAELAAIPRAAYARIKEQLRAETLARCRRIAEGGVDPLADSWLDGGTRVASAALLRRE